MLNVHKRNFLFSQLILFVSLFYLYRYLCFQSDSGIVHNIFFVEVYTVLCIYLFFIVYIYEFSILNLFKYTFLFILLFLLSIFLLKKCVKVHY